MDFKVFHLRSKQETLVIIRTAIMLKMFSKDRITAFENDTQPKNTLLRMFDWMGLW